MLQSPPRSLPCWTVSDAVETAESIILADDAAARRGSGEPRRLRYAADPHCRDCRKSDADAFRPIRYSKDDTSETQRQARRHNALLDALRKKRKAVRPQS
jgi:hypothetical protein